MLGPWQIESHASEAAMAGVLAKALIKLQINIFHNIPYANYGYDLQSRFLGTTGGEPSALEPVSSLKLGGVRMSQAFGLLTVVTAVFAGVGPALSADALQGRDIARRWCASCHVVEKAQTSATDQAPPFSYLARTPDFDQNKLAFLLLMPHPNMPQVSLNRAEIADLADYIRSLK